MASRGQSAADPRTSIGSIALRIGVTILILLATLAVFSYHAEDGQILAGGVGAYEPIRNLAGRFGAATAQGLISLLGLAAFPLAVFLLFCTGRRLLGRNLRPFGGLYLLGLACIAIGLSLFLGIFPNFLYELTDRLNISGTPGGVLGQRFSAPATEFSPPGWLSYVVNPLGSGIISAGLSLLGLAIVWCYDWHDQLLIWWQGYDARRERQAEPEEAPAGTEAVDMRAEIAAQLAPEPKAAAAPELPIVLPEPAPAPAKAALVLPEARTEAKPLAKPEPPAALEPAPELPPPAAAVAPAPMPAVSLPAPVLPPPQPPRAAPARPRATPPVEAGDYRLPPMKLLEAGTGGTSNADPRELAAKKAILQETLESFGIDAEVGEATCGPRVTLFEIKPAPGVKVERISSLQNNIAMNLKAESLRILTPIPGRDSVGIEVPNHVASAVPLRDILESSLWTSSHDAIPICLGRNISGEPVIMDLARAPHLLIAGATGSGKSVCMNSLIMSLLYRFRPDELKLVMVDPKVVEFSGYNSLPHLVTPVISDVKKVPIALRWVINQMEWRYRVLSKAGVRNIASYNKRTLPPEPVLDDEGNPIPARLPFLIVIIDELADIMMTAKADVETSLARIAQLARAVGIHAVVATQRPSVNIITGIIKANFPTRIAFQVSSVPDSRTILDTKGAESLLGRGDMLFKPPGGSRVERVQGTMVGDHEIEKVVEFVSVQGEPDFAVDIFKTVADVNAAAPEDLELEPEDASTPDRVRVPGFTPPVPAAGAPGEEASDEELIQRAIEVILRDRRATTSHLQRRLRVGYNRASLIIEELEQRGVVGPQIGQNPREILITGEALAAPATSES